jgi:hypothetical protein
MLRKSNIPIGASLVIVFVLSINLNIFPQSGFNDGVTLLMCAVRDGESSAFNRALKHRTSTYRMSMAGQL